MEISERTIGDLTILDLKGRLVEHDGDDVFRVAVDRLVELGRMKVLLNMDEVPYIDSCGLGVLASKYVTLRKRDGQLKLCNLNPRSSRGARDHQAPDRLRGVRLGSRRRQELRRRVGSLTPSPTLVCFHRRPG